MTRTVGIIGLGIMGSAMAGCLIERGWQVFGTDTDPARTDALAKAGGTPRDSIAAVCADAATLVTSLPSPKALAEVAAGIAATPAPRTVIETSTMALADKLAFRDTLHAAGHIALDCTISGTGAQALTRDLVILASGDPAAIAAAAALFADIARQAHDLGEYGNGTRMKFVANLLVAVHNVATAEAMVLGARAGLDPHKIVEVIGAGAGNSRVFEMRAPMMADRAYAPPTARVSLFQKDVGVIGDFARSLGLALPTFEAAVPVYEAAALAGLADQDVTVIHAVLERQR